MLADLDLFIIRWVPQTRAWLHLRCEDEHDVCTGFVAEVESLRRHSSLHADLPPCAVWVIGKCLTMLEQRAPREEMFDRAPFATRQLAAASSPGCAASLASRWRGDRRDALAQAQAHCWCKLVGPTPTKVSA